MAHDEIMYWRKVAHHETSHAVIAIRQGLTVKYTTIRPRAPGSAGTVKYYPQPYHTGIYEEVVRAKLAGGIGERIFTGRKIRPRYDESDRMAAEEIIDELTHPREPDFPKWPRCLPSVWALQDAAVVSRLTPAQLRRYHQHQEQVALVHLEWAQHFYNSAHFEKNRIALKRRLRRQTRAMVKRDWSAITIVAEALIDHRTLSGAEIRRIIDRVDRNLTPKTEGEMGLHLLS
jgi:hypothetical protein